MAKRRRLRSHQQDWVAGKIRIHRTIGTEVGIQAQADPVPHCVHVGVVLRGTLLSSLAYLLLSPSGRQNLTTRKTFKLLTLSLIFLRVRLHFSDLSLSGMGYQVRAWSC